MKKKDHYALLGVSRTEDTDGIRTAFRRLAKAYHPDVAGREETGHFQEITEAYCTLRDPESRREYNRNLRLQEQQERVGSKAGAAVSVRSKVVIQPQETSTRQGVPTTAVFEHFLNDLFGPGPLRNPHPVADLEVILSPLEAKTGGLLAVPVSEPCPYCGGSGRTVFFLCSHCGASGRLNSGQSVHLRIPPDIRDGTLLETVLGLSSRANSFRVLIRVREI
ncbi:MAG: DnaJ domain-containing protein [Desulforhabdus sp.]|jgi:DnaJ-class molecular chaperone|nr:DnaJ domain-containing protein [Desulforhabdus sp.]